LLDSSWKFGQAKALACRQRCQSELVSQAHNNPFAPARAAAQTEGITLTEEMRGAEAAAALHLPWTLSFSLLISFPLTLPWPLMLDPQQTPVCNKNNKITLNFGQS